MSSKFEDSCGDCCRRPIASVGRLVSSTAYCSAPLDVCHYGYFYTNASGGIVVDDEPLSPYNVLTSYSYQGYVQPASTPMSGKCDPIRTVLDQPEHIACKPTPRTIMEDFNPYSPFTVESSMNVRNMLENPKCSIPPHHFPADTSRSVEGVNRQLEDCSYEYQVFHPGPSNAMRAPSVISTARIRLDDYYSATGYVKAWVALYLFEDGEVSVEGVRTIEVNIPESQMRPYIKGNHSGGFSIDTPAKLGQAVGCDIVGYSFVKGYTPPHILAEDYDTPYPFNGFPYIPPVIDVYNAPPP